MTAALLGIDIGTSGCKALLVGVEGEVVGTGSAEYGVSRPQLGWSEQDPALWIEGARLAVAAALTAAGSVEVLGVGLSGQMHGLVPLDASKAVLRPAILWNDQRNAAECDALTKAAGGLEALLASTNNRMLVGYTGGKILWMRRHEADLFSRLRHVLNPKDYLRLTLTGEVATEVSDASGTGLFDVRRRCWASDLMGRVGIDPALFAPCHESAVVSSRLDGRRAALFGLDPGLPVVGGGGDSVVQSLGSGVIRPDELQTTIGTAGILAAALDQPQDNPDGRLQVFCNVAPDSWHCMGVSLNAGDALAWVREAWSDTGSCGQPSFDAMVAEAAGSPPGAKGLLFLPYLNGERCPHPDPRARGALVGLTTHHGRADVIRSVMEGVVHAFADMHALMGTMGIGGQVVKASGGGARSPLWRQMQADMFGCDVVTTEGAAEGAALGAALVAGVGVGVWQDAAVAAACCRERTRERPNARTGAVYRRANVIYRDLYPALRRSFEALGELALDA